MRRSRNILSFGLILLHTLYVSLTSADLPMHVEIKNLVGKWKIQRTQTSPKITTCGSSQPNSNIYNVKITDYKKYLLDNHYKFTSDMYVILSDDFVSYGDMHDTTGNEHRKNWKVLVVYDEHKRKIGTWTTVCDEGFEIRLGNETYTGLMHYEPTGKCAEVKEDDQTDTNGETDCYVTNFNKIRFGWVDITKPKGEKLYGCFYAERYHLPGEPVVVADTQNTFPKETGINSHLHMNHFYYPSLSTATSSSKDKPTFTTRKDMNINKNSELYWHKMKHFGKKKPLTRATMMAAKQKYACPCNKDEHVQDEINDGGNPPDQPVSPVSLVQMKIKSGDSGTNEMDLVNYEDTEKSPHRELDIDELPKNFTWGDPFNNNTREYDVTNQLSCGSCYIASQMYVFKRRIEIGLTKNLNKKYLNNFDDVLSIQTVLSCSFYDQGCNGGYPFLVSKMAKLQGIPLDKAFPYTATTQTCPYKVEQTGLVTPAPGTNPAKTQTKNLRQINAVIFSHPATTDMHNNYEKNTSDDPERWYAKDYNYIGGCYGCNQCNGEKIMMNEMYRNGPIVASLEVTPDFYEYADGVYYVKDFPHAKKCTVDVTKRNYEYNITGWEKVNHAIVLVGWGEEEIDGTLYKYWIGRNSWGKNWGKEGYFKVMRGVNFSAIESQALFIEPDFTRGAGKILYEKLKNE
ncbi:hypothetical protein AK88_04235 [Plasmodium fragile]|uniref:dipeptidyl-peptidase I n=1 Tax=Plasmodium fragile TaxID=5857 RepID=A0A0D9QH58_PLAFR|nr:uncharacterized protein AK88_04235 [Plasmodium fragile]KJP86112.1 hypothetical protein AK88_04235 [Plasmodium fragile]